MPYKELERQRRAQRGSLRKCRHGNWRQTYIDCQGMCQGILEDGSICGETETLEFHEPFGEDHNGEGRMQKRVLLCWHCHKRTTHDCTLNPRHYASKLQEDIADEILECGGYQKWLEKYELVDRKGVYEYQRL